MTTNEWDAWLTAGIVLARANGEQGQAVVWRTVRDEFLRTPDKLPEIVAELRRTADWVAKGGSWVDLQVAHDWRVVASKIERKIREVGA